MLIQLKLQRKYINLKDIKQKILNLKQMHNMTRNVGQCPTSWPPCRI